ncbi:hypothetical protein KY334_06165 [Candidatus Woesearchaeota archaeon]|nr:hypothetical protein [Candidatus Woesearchaeota archaeon]
MNTKMKTSLLFMIAVVAMLTVAGFANALPEILSVEINDREYSEDDYTNGKTIDIQKGEDIEVVVELEAVNAEKDVEVEIDILGYEYNDKEELSDSSHTFDLAAGHSDDVTLEVSVPIRADKDYYDLRIRVGSRTGGSEERLVRLYVKGVRHQIQVKDVLLHPANGVKAGSSVLVTARVTNRGEKDEEDVKVTARVPALNLEDSYYIEEVEEDESKTSEELYLRIPACVKAGTYDVEVEVEFDEGEETVTATKELVVMEGDFCEANEVEDVKTKIAVGSQVQQMTAGKAGTTYSLAITNPGSAAKTYTLAVSGVDAWGTYRVDPTATVLVNGGETKPVFVFVSASEEATEGQKPFAVTIASGAESQTVQYYANVMKEESSLNNWAKYVLIALIVVLIVIGLIIGFSRMRGSEDFDEDDEELSGQTYY